MSTLIKKYHELTKELEDLNSAVADMIDTPFLFSKTEVRAALRKRANVYKEVVTLERVLR